MELLPKDFRKTLSSIRQEACDTCSQMNQERGNGCHQSSESGKQPKYYRQTARKTIRTGTALAAGKRPMEVDAMHQQSTVSPDSKKRKLASPTPPTQAHSAQEPEQQMKSAKLSGQDLSQVIKRLIEHTLHLKEKVECIDDIDFDVDDLLQSVNKLDDDVVAINSKVNSLGEKVAWVAKEIQDTRNEISEVKELVKNMDAQLEQERELKRMHEADDQKRFKAMLANLDALVAHFVGNEL
ncbi:hypothetical protein GSI_10368 [Ganoderma sinense ZZ0214-1]|uniref:Uncharacterized protein n=1 Tax=Ganoderma sinense ZZ0214-1 TaxID=1077348 RepID=A0A2G8S0F7_9APHY|nr:hypothetical protein GSI_10368 [Ganoderma sinense ZZ0214-1]